MNECFIDGEWIRYNGCSCDRLDIAKLYYQNMHYLGSGYNLRHNGAEQGNGTLYHFFSYPPSPKQITKINLIPVKSMNYTTFIPIEFFNSKTSEWNEINLSQSNFLEKDWWIKEVKQITPIGGYIMVTFKEKDSEDYPVCTLCKGVLS